MTDIAILVLEVIANLVRVVLSLPLTIFDGLHRLLWWLGTALFGKADNARMDITATDDVWPDYGKPRNTRKQTAPDPAHTPWQSEAKGELSPVHRGLVALRPKQAYVDWVRQLSPEWSGYTIRRARKEDGIAYLVSGARLVREWDPVTSSTRTWYETVDNAGNIRSVAPKPATDALNHRIFDANGKYTGRR